jgi:hypothetical protein
LHELDEFIVEELIPKYNKGIARKKNADYSKRYTLTELEKEIIMVHPQIRKALLRVKHNRYVSQKRFTAMDSKDTEFKRLKYIRYADDFLIGFIGSRKEAESIKDKIVNKLKDLKLEINQEKSKIYHSSERHIKYLGVYMRYFNQNKIKWRKDGNDTDEITRQVPHRQAQSVNTVHFRVPVDIILNRLVDKGLAQRRVDGTVRGTAYVRFCMMEDDKIVSRFSAMIRGLINYYSCVNKRSDLWKIFAILRKSCALTLARKHKLNSAARVFAKYGPSLKVKNNLGNEIGVLTYPKSLKTKIDFKIRKKTNIQYANILEVEINKVQGSTKTNLKTATFCEYEGCNKDQNLEAHHINPVGNLYKRKDLSSFEKALIKRKRKVVMLCKKHYQLLHDKQIFM